MDSTNRADDSDRRVSDILARYNDLERQEHALEREFEEKQRQLNDIIRQQRNLTRERITLLTSRRNLSMTHNTTNIRVPINSGTVDPDIDNSEDSDEDTDEDTDEDIPEGSAGENSVTWNKAKPEEKTFFMYDTCCICQDEEPTIFNMPCGHVCLCKDCNTKNMGRNECPI